MPVHILGSGPFFSKPKKSKHKCSKCGLPKKSKLEGGSHAAILGIRNAIVNISGTRQAVRNAIEIRGYTALFQLANVIPEGNGRLTRPQQVALLDFTYMLAQLEAQQGFMTQEEADTFKPAKKFTKEEVQDFIRNFNNKPGGPPPPPPPPPPAPPVLAAAAAAGRHYRRTNTF